VVLVLALIVDLLVGPTQSSFVFPLMAIVPWIVRSRVRRAPEPTRLRIPHPTTGATAS
jgi:hypothetical protein